VEIQDFQFIILFLFNLICIFGSRLDRNSLRGAIPPNISNLVNLNEL